VSFGAPVNGSGMPLLIGKQTLFSVYNDLDVSRHHFGSLPLGAEVQQTIYGYGGAGSLSNTLFIKFKIVNRSAALWDSTYATLWSDPDIGDATDDLVGSDVNRDLGFAYNGNPVDAIYGSTPPSIGEVFLKGTGAGKSLRSFGYFASGGGPGLTDPSNANQLYDFIKGLKGDGSSFVDPTTHAPTLYPLNGDPVAITGWNDASPSDRRMLINSAPFSLAPGESKEIEFAIVVGQGTNNINSISQLRNAVDNVHLLYAFGPNPPSKYHITNTSDQGPGSLREAISYANTHPGLDTLVFEIAGPGPYVIVPSSPLPTIIDSVLLDGTTQPGYSSLPIIELDGSHAGPTADGLRFQSSGSKVKGLVINRFAKFGLVLTGIGTTGNCVQGNFIGTNATGTAALGNGAGGVLIIEGASNNIIGGSNSVARNIISGNGGAGVTIKGPSTAANKVFANFIGTTISGNAALGNAFGVSLDSAANTSIGSTTPGTGNLISGNGLAGIYVTGNGTTIQGNLIGTDLNGMAAIPNAAAGGGSWPTIYVNGPS
jgi:hypothetical protein